MHKQKDTKLGSRKLLFATIDYIERPAAHTLQKLAQVTPPRCLYVFVMINSHTTLIIWLQFGVNAQADHPNCSRHHDVTRDM